MSLFNTSTSQDSFWWMADEECLAKEAYARVREIEDLNSGRFDEMDTLSKLYQGKSSLTINQYGITEGDDSVQHEGRTGTVPRFNLVKTVIDSWVSIVGAQTPRPKLLTTAGDWKEQTLASDLNAFLLGAMYVSKIQEVMQEALLDGGITGSGPIRLEEDERGNWVAKRIQPTQLLVDETLCPAGEEPIECFQRTPEHIASICHKYPEKADELKKTKGFGRGGRQRMVYEGWYVGDDGPVYVKFVDEVLLETKPWTKVIPFLVYMPQKPRGGYYGVGLAESLKCNQMRIEEIQLHISEMQRQVARPTIISDAATMQASNIPEFDRVNILSAPGGKSWTVYTPDAVSPEVYREVDRISEGAKEEVGISSYSTANSLPAGVDSAPAQREFNIRENRRHGVPSKRYEALVVEWGYKTIQLYAWSSKGSKRAKVRYVDRSAVTVVEWPKIDLDKLEYVVSIEAASMATMTPSGRLQTVMELAQSGILLGQEELRDLIGNPDLDSSQKYSIGAFNRFALKQVNQLEMGKDISPDSLVPIAIQKGKAQAAYAAAVVGDAPPDIIANIVRFINECLALEEQMTAAMAPPPTDEGMPIPQVSRAAAQGLDSPFSGGGSSSQGI